MKYANISPKKRDQIIDLYEHKVVQSVIAEIMNLSVASVESTIRAYTAVRDDDVEFLTSDASMRYRKAAIEWALAKLGKEWPKKQECADAIEETVSVNETPEKNEDKKSAVDTTFYICQMLQLLREQNELLTQIADTVIPHWASDIKDNINANFNVLGGEAVKATNLLEGIKCNTRKRGT